MEGGGGREIGGEEERVIRVVINSNARGRGKSDGEGIKITKGHVVACTRRRGKLLLPLLCPLLRLLRYALCMRERECTRFRRVSVSTLIQNRRRASRTEFSIDNTEPGLRSSLCDVSQGRYVRFIAQTSDESNSPYVGCVGHLRANTYTIYVYVRVMTNIRHEIRSRA